MNSVPILISIEGNIGAGKSTLLRKIKDAHPEWFYVDEPVDQWLALKDDDDVSLLDHFYQDKSRWAYTFQNVAVLTRAEALRKTLDAAAESGLEHPIIIMERCLETDAEVFAKMLKEEGAMNAIEWDLYERWRKVLVENFNLPKTTAYIWVDTPPIVCKERIRQRAREGEDDIALEYLECLDDAHIEWLQKTWDAPEFLTRTTSWITHTSRTEMDNVNDFFAQVIDTIRAREVTAQE